MWAASLSDIFNTILDGIGGFFSGLWHADIPLTDSAIIAAIFCLGLLAISGGSTVVSAKRLRGLISELLAEESWLAKGEIVIAFLFWAFLLLFALICFAFLGLFFYDQFLVGPFDGWNQLR